jgi:hypothetical protein
MENLGLVRALLFLLGTLPQAVKLLCFGGIPWTKTWAALFLISYVTTEMLLFLRKTLGNTTQLDHFPPLRINRRNSVLVNLSGVRSIFTGLAVFLQMGLLVWACSEVFKPSRLQRLIQHDHALSALLFPLWVFMISSTISLIFFLTWLVFLTLCQRFFHDSPVTAMVAALIGSSMASGAFFWQILTATDVRTTLLGFLFPFILVLALLMAALGFMRFEVLRREIFLHSEEIRLGGQDPDDWSKWNSITAWGMFVVIILISILWYAFCYSPEGTHKPGWTNKLG